MNRYYLKSFLFIFLNLCLLTKAYGQININTSNNSITISNDVVRKEFTISSKKPGSITVSSLYDKINDQELLNGHNSSPWFEFVINNELVTSNKPLWKYIGFSQRTLRNKGTEYTLHFKGVTGTVKGLHLSIKEQLFPGSTLVREQLILHVKNKAKFELNKYKNKLHFIFPRYTYKCMNGCNSVNSTEIRIATWGGQVLDSVDNSSYHTRLNNGSDLNLSQAHMFHPETTKRIMNTGDHLSFKGPFGLMANKNYTFMMAYEHASQDTLIYGIRRGHDISAQAQQNLNFLKITQRLETDRMSSTVKIVRGGYLDGEKISIEEPYKSIWVATGFYSNKEENQPKKLLYNYLLKWITEYPHTRETKFYYNTWAMQRDEVQGGGSTKAVLTYDRIFEEIKYAHQLGVEIFILDYGWAKMSGVWKPKKSLSKGLKPIYNKLKKYGMKLGVWMSPQFIDPQSERFKQHSEWVVRDNNGNPVKVGSAAIFDFVSGFSDKFIQDCKWLIDHGVRYFKWDALGTYYPYRTNGFHGNLKVNSKKEIIARYGYLFPLYVKRAMIKLMEYNSDVVIEIDLTENSRALMGLSTLSAGKIFFMNNGASVYGDKSQYRAKSSRIVANEYVGIIPLQLFTYANYPIRAKPFKSLRYNINSSIVAGRGLWGNLSLTTAKWRKKIGELLNKAKRVAPYIKNTMTSVIGRVGSSPEIYTKVNAKKAAGQVIVFSGSAMNYTHKIILNKNNFLGVLHNAYTLKGDTLKLKFQFPMADASREAFILPNRGSGIKIISCTSWLRNIHLDKNKLSINIGAPGQILISWPKDGGYPQIDGGQMKTKIRKKGSRYLIEIDVQERNEHIVIK